MFPLPISFYIYAGLTLLALAGFGYGRYEYNALQAYKLEVAVAQKTQEAKVESITKQQDLVSKSIKDEYEAKLAAVRNYYKSTSVWNNGSPKQVSGLSPTSQLADAIASYNGLALRCSETTLQLIELQKWLTEQMTIK